VIIAPKKFTDHFPLFKANHREIVKAEIVLDKENFSFSFLTKLQFVNPTDIDLNFRFFNFNLAEQDEIKGFRCV
tara:strand:+ start:346 stop:567 length:222 start_codon:yes stop_codon:yes gene_type:complete